MSIKNLILNKAIRVILDGNRAVSTLPSVFAALARNAISSFPALRPHQRHAWHAFLVQLGALALLRAGREAMPEDEETWRDLLRGLTADFPGDEPWCLVAPPDRPALLQPPIPGGLKDLKNAVPTPDALDMLVTSKNHDLKSEVMMAAEPDDWLFALVALQTSEGFLGAGNYGISRMNGGFANRPAFSVVPTTGPVSPVRRDVEALVALRKTEGASTVYAAEGGLGLVWLRPWDGATALPPSELDPLHIEICRRVRLVEEGGRIAARAGGSKVARIVPIPGGAPGDPWAPTVTDKDGPRILTVDAGGFHYRRIVRLLFEREGHALPVLAATLPTDAEEGLVVLARALTRGQGKTEGWHERRLPISRTVYRALRTRATDAIGRAATERVALAGEIQNRVLKPALLALFQNGPDQVDYQDKGANARARDLLARFDRAVDATFFEDLWAEVEPDADPDAVRTAWVRRLVNGVAWPLVVEADAGLSKAVGRRWRALVRAEAVFRAGTRNPKSDLPKFFPEPKRDDAA
ncbi:type I-E CRISPR-associated protein Cse1/CasA [Methylobacterium terrae]|uniref:Type I-E CRISPR-associated protein Cse1/CasA n=1 Tax=Methylobacterium terrae TaxID=2202827 RepID=A0A2U8WN28_9HYPH|nr:type I-E CRISPR-associated protein Cse1/CasA [Methylobacterium terrae]AWN47559.1 type I-E CRISPR-associated protein Cse1/CasA [Methylobacterium terrae]